MSGQLRTTDYPANWDELRQQALARAGNRCECRGECSSSHRRGEARNDVRCAAPNGVEIIRNPYDPGLWWLPEDLPAWMGTGITQVRIVLTTAHLCRDSTCGELDHLRMMCQRCHLIYDKRQHVSNAAATRMREKEQAGQLTFLEVHV